MFTTLMLTTCLLWNDDIKFYLFELREKDWTRVKVLRLWDATFINCCIHVPSNLFPLFHGRDVPVALCLPFSAFLFPALFLSIVVAVKKLGRPLTFLITFPSAKAWCLRFAIRNLSIIEGLLDDSLISVCVIDAWERNDEDAVLAHQLLRMRKTTCFQQKPWDLAGSGNSPL